MSEQEPQNRETTSGQAQPERVRPIVEDETSISYLGVRLSKAESRGVYSPDRSEYDDFIEDDYSLELQKKIAVAWSGGEPILIEGGTSIGKTTTAKKMAAELGYEVHYVNLNGLSDPEQLMGRYIPNPHRHNPQDPEYIFVDGPVTRGLRQEKGKTKVIVVDEFNAARPEVVIRLHEILDALERDGQVVLSEDAAEVLTVTKETTKMIALTNPPGRGYLGREPLDPAQLRRWIYQKEATTLPDESLMANAKAMFGLGETVTFNPEKHTILSGREQGLTTAELAEIPGIAVILDKYREFHRGAQKLVASRDIAADQPQPFTFDDRMELRRVRDFVGKFYNGDINETMQQALLYYYVGKVEDPADQAKLKELMAHVRYVPESDSRRRDLGDTTQTPEGSRSTSEYSQDTAELLEQLHLHEQYEYQVNRLMETGIVERDPSGAYIITDIEGHDRPMPSYEEVVRKVEAQSELIRTKAEQGFTKFLLVPFGAPIAKLVESYGQVLKNIEGTGELKSSDGTELDLNTTEPVWLSDAVKGKDESGDLLYYPEEFAESNGLTKSEWIDRGDAWQVLFVEDLKDIPTPATAEAKGGRPQLGSGREPNYYLGLTQSDPVYSDEVGLTPESWLTLALMRLYEDREVLDDYQGTGKACLLTASWLEGSGLVPFAWWRRGSRRAVVSDAFPDGADQNVGVRSAVRIP